MDTKNKFKPTKTKRKRIKTQKTKNKMNEIENNNMNYRHQPLDIDLDRFFCVRLMSLPLYTPPSRKKALLSLPNFFVSFFESCLALSCVFAFDMLELDILTEDPFCLRFASSSLSSRPPPSLFAADVARVESAALTSRQKIKRVRSDKTD